MSKKKMACYMLSGFILVSFLIKMVLIFKYGNLLNLSSDDLNYIKSAIVLMEKGILTYQNYNEPTVFIMPIYPLFLAAVFKIFGYGFTGMQAVRIIQAVLSCITIFLVFLICRKLFNTKAALAASFLVSFYLPNITTTGYMLTETLFITLLYVLIYFSFRFSTRPTVWKFVILGIIWAVTTLCRPTIALYPVLLFLYLLLYVKLDILKTIKMGAAMGVTFVLIMSPWWIRNYMEYETFIPLTASSGNPMLQGTYVNYIQSPDKVVYYTPGKNAFETNKIEISVAKKRIKSEFKKDFWGYLKWYTYDKTIFFWGTVFYWKEFFRINWSHVIHYHSIILLGFLGMIILILNKKFLKYILPISVIIYFNVIHCIYMAFDRYALPVLPLLAMFSGYLLSGLYGILFNSGDLKQR